MLALLNNLNEYICVSNTNIHLCASIKKPCRVLIPYSADWRWRLKGSSPSWFPDFTVYRQSKCGDWTNAFKKLHIDLKKI